MRTLNQIIAVPLLNLRNLPQRIGSSLVAVIGVAAVVLVFAAVLSMAKGFERTMVSAGAEDTAVILRSGSTSGCLSISTLPGDHKPGKSTRGFPENG